MATTCRQCGEPVHPDGMICGGCGSPRPGKGWKGKPDPLPQFRKKAKTRIVQPASEPAPGNDPSVIVERMRFLGRLTVGLFWLWVIFFLIGHT